MNQCVEASIPVELREAWIRFCNSPGYAEVFRLAQAMQDSCRCGRMRFSVKMKLNYIRMCE